MQVGVRVEGLAHDAVSVDLRTQLCRIHGAGNHEEALRLIQVVTASRPDEPYGWKVAALLYFRIGRSEDSERALRRLGPRARS